MNLQNRTIKFMYLQEKWEFFSLSSTVQTDLLPHWFPNQIMVAELVKQLLVYSTLYLCDQQKSQTYSFTTIILTTVTANPNKPLNSKLKNP